MRVHLGFVDAKTSRLCNQCGGEGVCLQASDYGVREEIIQFAVEAGTPEGYEIIIPCKGDEMPNHKAGDVVFRVVYKEHEVFRLSPPLDLMTDIHITLVEFLTGFERQIICLNGERLDITLQRGKLLQSFTETIAGKGLQYRGSSGDLVINIRLDVPKELPVSIVDSIEALFSKYSCGQK